MFSLVHSSASLSLCLSLVSADVGVRYDGVVVAVVVVSWRDHRCLLFVLLLLLLHRLPLMMLLMLLMLLQNKQTFYDDAVDLLFWHLHLHQCALFRASDVSMRSANQSQTLRDYY